MKISEIDRAHAVETNIGDENTVFLDVRQAPFTIHGVLPADEETPYYHRMPQPVADASNDGVSQLNHHTAGGRVRFMSNSPYVAIHTRQAEVLQMSHMTICGSGGFDLYASEDGGEDEYMGTFKPGFFMQEGYDSIVRLPDSRMRLFTIHMPLYGGVNELQVGLDKEADVLPAPAYAIEKPVVYYGSSITQGGCASRPGTSYQAILSRALQCDHINLGFSGSARGEQATAQHIASLDMSAFVMDYDHNARSPEELQATHEPFYQTVRKAHPDMPIIMVSQPKVKLNEDGLQRIAIIRHTYEKALAAGDRNVYFVDGRTFFDCFAGDCATVDGAHPNDFGFVCMAQGLLPVLRKALKGE